MLTEKANHRIRALHRKVGADPRHIVEKAIVLIDACGGMSADDRRILAPGTRTSFFEVWSPFWLMPETIGNEIKIRLGAAMLASWTGIAQIDRTVDEGEVRNCKPGHMRRARIWSDFISSELHLETVWPRLLDRWSHPLHGSSHQADSDELILDKNPFYPEIFDVYMGRSDASARMGRAYTLIVGILDEVADIADDVANSRPNYVLAKNKIDISMSYNSIVREVLVNDLIGRTLTDAKEALLLLQRDTKERGFHLFARSLEHLWPSLSNFEEFCVAKLITHGGY